MSASVHPQERTVSAAPCLVATKLRRSFELARGAAPIVAVDDVSFTIARGESLGLVGESGSGKSTIARILAGLERADGGQLTVDGEDRLSRRRGGVARLRRAREIQMVFQDPFASLDRRLTAGETLELVLRLHGNGDRLARRSRVEELFDQVGLRQNLADQKPHQLSGGQLQRVAIARALAAEPTILVLDEAVSALDVSVQAQVLRLLDEIRRNTGVGLLFVTHDLAVVSEVSDRLLVLHGGRVVEEGPTGTVLASPQRSYTQMLISSAPGEGWDPEEVIERRRALTGVIRTP